MDALQTPQHRMLRSGDDELDALKMGLTACDVGDDDELARDELLGIEC